MCGILFSSNSTSSKKVFTDSLDTIIHRGPDDFGIYSPKKGIFLGSRRLAIQDLSPKGHMPMLDSSKRYSIVFNGEVYNFKEIKKDLSEFSFRSEGDTEVVLYSYIKWGAKCLKRFNGMFAFVIYDKKENKVFFARDRFGQKPLLYSYNGHSLIIGSEAKQIISIDKSLSRIDELEISNILSFRYVPNNNTGYKKIKMLKPSFYSEFVLGEKLVEKKYWDYSALKINSKLSLEESIRNSEELLIKSVKLRLISDVPVGVFLSGGLDSSLITAIASNNYPGLLHTFSVGYSRKDKETELDYAKVVAKKYGTNHKEIIVNFKDYDLPATIDTLFTKLDRPIADPAILPSFIMSREVAKYTKVVLNGDGGDEIFSGYPKVFDIKKIYDYYKLPRFLRRSIYQSSKIIGSQRATFLLEGLSDNRGKAILYKLGCFHPNITNGYYIDKKSILKDGFFHNNSDKIMNKYFSTNSAFIDSQNFDVLSYMPDDTLPKVDFATMSASIEARSPFLDFKLAQFAFSIPFKQRLHHNTNKYIIKSMAEKYLSSDIIYRKKQGFSVPLQSWFNKELNAYIKDTLLSKNAFISAYTNKNYVEKLIKDNNKIDYSNHLWVLLALEKWGKNFS